MEEMIVKEAKEQAERCYGYAAGCPANKAIFEAQAFGAVQLAMNMLYKMGCVGSEAKLMDWWNEEMHDKFYLY